MADYGATIKSTVNLKSNVNMQIHSVLLCTLAVMIGYDTWDSSDNTHFFFLVKVTASLTLVAMEVKLMH